jgi:allophanate hydrolase
MNELPVKNFLISDLLAGYRAGRFTPAEVIDAVLKRIDAAPERNVWITRLSREQVFSYVHALPRSMDELPLYGVPFAIKDNIDLANVATTAGCPGYRYVPSQSATVVQKLIAAGAIPIGKTNLDQFATGLVGTRSPYGACQNSFNNEFISGGSSSGSAVAVATGLVSFALGTDTAGSGRIPAAFNNIVGLKPSCGMLSTQGVVPACRSLDCVSIFALTAPDAARVLDVARGFDSLDAYSRPFPVSQDVSVEQRANALRIGVPRRDQLQFFGDAEYARLFEAAQAQAREMGADVIEVDFAPLLEVARLLYEGPWVAERYAGIAEFMQTHADALHPVTREIIAGGIRPTAVDAFRAQYRLKELQRSASVVWRDVDMLMTPTAGTVYTIAQLLADPIKLNSNLGYYTNFVNLLDLAAVAVPAGFRSDGLPFGVTLTGVAASEAQLLRFASTLHVGVVATLGALDLRVPEVETAPPQLREGYIPVVVCGAHMSGLPLNPQLRDRNAYLLRATRTSAHYEFYALPGGPPRRPGLVRVQNGGGAIDVEVWAVPQQHFGSFVAGIPSPLGIGKVELEDGSLCPGFLCESWAVEGAQRITELGSWRKFSA